MTVVDRLIDQISSQRHGGVVYEHLESNQEPLLWIPNALGWCYGAGGDWRRRVAAALNAVVDCDQL